MAESHFKAPAEVLTATLESGVKKSQLPTMKMVLMGIMAGIFIGLGGATSSTAVHTLSDVGLARTLAGCIFPIGLIMIVIVGGELFTGNNLMLMGVMDKRFSAAGMARNLIIVYFSNMIGSIIIAAVLSLSGNFDLSGGLLGAYTIKVAAGKASIAPIKGIASGILCNILVCAAILMTTAATDITGKLLAAFFPVLAFVTGGFEHCVANMFYISAGIFASMNPAYVAKAQEVYGVTAQQLASLGAGGMVNNLISVTIGNMIGGMIFVAVPFYLVQKSKKV